MAENDWNDDCENPNHNTPTPPIENISIEDHDSSLEHLLDFEGIPVGNLNFLPWIGTYILDPSTNTPVPCRDIFRWAEWYATTDRTVLKTFLTSLLGEIEVSTVFLGIDANPFSPIPFLWETMVFGPTDSNYTVVCRYTSVQAAVEGHELTVEGIRTNPPERFK
jgi:hypothetical protein